MLEDGARIESARPEPSEQEWSALMDAESVRQIEKGYTPEYDAKHGPRHLLNWAIDYARRGKSVESATMMRSVLRLLDRGDGDA